jgi:hypothetical protein
MSNVILNSNQVIEVLREVLKDTPESTCILAAINAPHYFIDSSYPKFRTKEMKYDVYELIEFIILENPHALGCISNQEAREAGFGLQLDDFFHQVPNEILNRYEPKI